MMPIVDLKLRVLRELQIDLVDENRRLQRFVRAVSQSTPRQGAQLVVHERFGAMMWMNFPVTARVDAPHFGAGLLGVATIAALAFYGALVAARGRRRGLTAIS